MPTKKESRPSDAPSLVPKPRRRASTKVSAPSGAPSPSVTAVKTVAKRTVRKTNPGPDSVSGDAQAAIIRKPREPLTHEQIAVRAYYIAERWRAEGRDTSDEGVWLEAERQMRSEQGGNG